MRQLLRALIRCATLSHQVCRGAGFCSTTCSSDATPSLTTETKNCTRVCARPCLDLRAQKKHHRCGLSGINYVPRRKYSCRNPAHRQPADAGEERMSEEETGWVNYAAEPTHRRSNERTRESGLRTAADTRPTGPFSAAGFHRLRV